MTELRAHEISVQTQEANLVSAASFVLKPGEFTVVLGPNGAGKTSLIRASLGLLRPTKGTAAINGQDVMALSPIERAKQIAYLPQMRPLAWPNRVRNIVALGLFSHGAAPARLSAQDALAVEKALQDCDLVHLADRHADTLSGGEIARMHCARSFVANAPLLIADEPIAALDPRHQFGILDLIKAYTLSGGGALVVLHNIQLAAQYATRLIWMRDGQIVSDGTPEETLTSERIKAVYDVRAEVDGLRIEMHGPRRR